MKKNVHSTHALTGYNYHDGLCKYMSIKSYMVNEIADARGPLKKFTDTPLYKAISPSSLTSWDATATILCVDGLDRQNGIGHKLIFTIGPTRESTEKLTLPALHAPTHNI